MAFYQLNKDITYKITDNRTSSPSDVPMTSKDLLAMNSFTPSPRSSGFPLDLLLDLSDLQNKEKAFLKQALPPSSIPMKDYKQSYKSLLTSIQNKLVPSKSFPHPCPGLTQKLKSLKSEIYRQTLEISKLKSDNKLLTFELESIQNEVKEKKSKNQTTSRTELLALRSELLAKLKSRSQELERKKILAYEFQKELSLLQVSNQNLKNYLYEMKGVYGNLNFRAKSLELGPSTRKNRCQV